MRRNVKRRIASCISFAVRNTYKLDQHLFSLFYKDRFLDLIHNFIIFDNGIKKVCRITNLKPTGWQTKYMKTRWGTCNTVTKKIWLNVQLAKKTPEDIPKVTNFWDISVLLHRTTAHPRSEMYVLVHS